MGLNPEYVRYFMVPEEKVRPRCPHHGVPMEDGDAVEKFFCVLCLDERPPTPKEEPF